MLFSVKGVVLSETCVGEYDKIMTVLTERGRYSVYANGARRLKNPNFAGTQLYAYSEMVLEERGEKHYLKEASLVESFFKIRDTMEGIALTGYIADVASDISVDGDDTRDILRLVLNSFYAIAESKKPTQQIKAVFELRSLCIAGYTPDIVGCAGCGKFDLPVYYFDAEGGNFLCEDCFKKESALIEDRLRRVSEGDGIYAGSRLILILSLDVYVAMRYVVFCRPERIFAFELRDGAMEEFCSVCEKYLRCHIDKDYKTLRFYKEITSM